MPPKTGSFQNDLPFAKDLLDTWLSRVPRLYLFLDRFRKWENWDRRVYLSLIRPGDVVFDVGANVGAHTIALSRIVGKRGRVVSFEPVKASYANLLENVRRRTRFDNVTALNVAVGNPRVLNEKAVIRIPGDDFTQASLMPHTVGSWDEDAGGHAYDCTITSIDAEFERNPLSRLDFMKIDVEGGELDVLKGAARTLRNYRPFVYCEVYERWASSFGYTPSDLFACMRSLGYSQARVIREGVVSPVALSQQAPSEMFDVSADVLFFMARHTSLVASFDQRYHVRVSANG